jgi:hypothetical protein
MGVVGDLIFRSLNPDKIALNTPEPTHISHQAISEIPLHPLVI